MKMARTPVNRVDGVFFDVTPEIPFICASRLGLLPLFKIIEFSLVGAAGQLARAPRPLLEVDVGQVDGVAAVAEDAELDYLGDIPKV